MLSLSLEKLVTCGVIRSYNAYPIIILIITIIIEAQIPNCVG